MEDKTFELLEKMYIEFNKRFDQVDKRFEQIDERFEQIDERFEQIDKRFDQVDKKFEQTDRKIDNNTILLENLRKDMRTVAEGQMSNIEANKRQHEDIKENIDERTDVIEMAVKHNAILLDDVNNKMDDARIDINTITRKVVENDTEIIKINRNLRKIK
jgi:chromosome segregation ATPase